MSEIKTGRLKADWKWLDGGGWQVGSIAVTERDGMFLMRAYHTGELSWQRPEALSRYPIMPISEPEART